MTPCISPFKLRKVGYENINLENSVCKFLLEFAQRETERQREIEREGERERYLTGIVVFFV